MLKLSYLERAAISVSGQEESNISLGKRLVLAIFGKLTVVELGIYGHVSPDNFLFEKKEERPYLLSNILSNLEVDTESKTGYGVAQQIGFEFGFIKQNGVIYFGYNYAFGWNLVDQKENYAPSKLHESIIETNQDLFSNAFYGQAIASTPLKILEEHRSGVCCLWFTTTLKELNDINKDLCMDAIIKYHNLSPNPEDYSGRQ